MFTDMGKKDDFDDHFSDWMAGPGGVVAAIIAAIIVGALLWSAMTDFLS